MTPATPYRSGRSHDPALDGIRAVSVALVLAFHGGWGWMTGGYVGVSVFFTLSGFLITRLLLDEYAATGRIGYRDFVTRRARRLMPASLLTLAVVALVGVAGVWNDPHLGRRLLGALLSVANWVELAGSQSYAEQIGGAESPLSHFWSLAIEEQFYLVWPLALLAIVRRWSPPVALALATGAAAVVAVVIARTAGPDAAYWTTPARIGEILVGATLAAVLHRRRTAVPAGFAQLSGWVGIAVVVWAAVAWPATGGPATEGWLTPFALASAALIVGAGTPGPLRSVLGTAPLAALGRISYGVYLIHWPLFVWWDVDGRAGRFVVVVLVTLVLAAVSSRWYELPIRAGAVPPRRLVAAVVAAAVALPVAGVVAARRTEVAFTDPEAVELGLRADSTDELGVASSTSEPSGTVPQADGPRRRAAASIGRTTTATTEPDATPASAPAGAVAAPSTTSTTVPVGDVEIVAAPSRPVRMLVLGDSTAWQVGVGMRAWADDHPALARVDLVVSPGCGFVRAGHVPDDDPWAADCDELLDDRLPEALDRFRPDVVIVMSTFADVRDRRWTDDDPPIPVTDPEARARVIDAYRLFTAGLLTMSEGRVVWVVPPAASTRTVPDSPMADPATMQVLRDAIVATAAGDPTGRVGVVDLAGWYVTSGLVDAEARPDGVHFDDAPAAVVAERLVGPATVNLAVGISGG